ncbi:LysR family transcriptional regulator [Luteibacter anthropi]|uniref:LysR family transcriptional regulator n=1 Tax=Luteibacter anthropi TaxID=564369 RepID=A0A7X5ZIC2_9GAMM|nr:LysR family transcriptional regulator [Luteibacter anthropi]NII06753.1 LysR family transcriptional regulator [Luteibacter anthropi]
MAAPDLNLLIALDALLTEGSVAGAARRMNLSAPAMSRTLGRIRDALGDPVFVQSGRTMVPTPRALEMRERVRQAVEDASALLAPGIDVDLTGIERRFAVRANDIFVGMYAGRLLDTMSREMPRATLRFTPEEDDIDGEALRSGRIDLLVNPFRPVGPEMRVQPLFSTRFVGVARKGHPFFDGPVTAERFVQWQHIGVSRRGRARGPIDDALEALGLARQVPLVVPTPYAGAFALLDSDLLLPLPNQLAEGVLRAGLDVQLFELPVPLEPVDISQTWHPRWQNDPAHRWLRRTIRQLCGH